MMQETQTTAAPEKQRPIQTFRSGAIGGSIWERQTNDGKTFYDFTVSRAWKNDEKSGYSPNFGARNRDDVLKVVADCADWIEKQEA